MELLDNILDYSKIDANNRRHITLSNLMSDGPKQLAKQKLTL